MNALLRILGLNVLAQVGSRMSSPAARTTTSIVLIAANLLPLWAVLRGDMGVGDVFVIYWFENVVVWFTSTIKILTARGVSGPTEQAPRASNAPLAGFFALHFGIFTVVHGAFSFTIAGLTGGFTGDRWTWVILLAAITASHVFSLGLNWFGQGERNVVSAGRAMAAPYPRMVVLHLSVIGAFFLLLGRPDEASNDIAPVALLCGIKTFVDVCFHLRERYAFRHRSGLAQSPAEAP